jgi:hypothetical protein
MALAWALAGAANAVAQAPPPVVGPYAGEVPFRCELQNVGTGTDFPDPDADPFCVEFDKTNQNVTDFGLVEFTAQEPARVAAAGTKCFYFQRDHWTGSVVQGNAPELWHWDGDYFFDRARGVGGVSVRNLRVGGAPMNAGPFVPPGYAPYFDEAGGGGVEVLLETNPDPICGAKVDTPEERRSVYGGAAESQCIDPAGQVRGKRVGRATLGARRASLRARLGPPTFARAHLDAWCLVGKGELRAAYNRRDRAHGLLTSGSGQGFHGVTPGDKVSRARRLLDLRRNRVSEILRAAKRVLLGIEGRRVRWVALIRTGKARTRALERLASDLP